jgi:hypothetical protein
MKPYLKDSHGDPRSPINNVINGLFFGTDVNSAKSSQSIYGRKRFKISSSKLVTSSTRAYFADFYCVPGRMSPRPHYITIVLTEAGSKADSFCSARLVSLNLQQNPFFKIERSLCGGFVTLVATYDRIYVELLYTEDINIHNVVSAGDASLSNVTLASYGSEIRHPRSKNSSCTVCNLHVAVESDYLELTFTRLRLSSLY